MSVYEKDVFKLKVMLIITIVLSIILVSYAYFYNFNNKEDNVYLTTVYNTGVNSCVVDNTNVLNDLEGPLKGVSCKFTVVGYNKSNKDLSYKIILKNNPSSILNSQFIKLYLVDSNSNVQVGPFNGNILDNNFNEEIKILKNSEVFDEYTLKLWVSEEELINNNWYSLDKGNYSVNVSVMYQ